MMSSGRRMLVALSLAVAPAGGFAPRGARLLHSSAARRRHFRSTPVVSMALKTGIVGLPNVGKSTLFNALMQESQAQAANFPFCTIEPNVGVVAVPDKKLEVLGEISNSAKLVPTSLSFVDIAGFTHLSERLPPAELIALLNGYFERATAMVADAGGVVVGFAGDGFLAAFNAPRSLDQHAACALRAARDLQDLVRDHRFGGERVRIRIGIATGPVAAGIVGGSSHQTFTVYGDTVNLAQRLESMCKAHDTYLLVAETSWSAAGRPPGLLEIGPVEVRGRDSRVRAYAAARQVAQQEVVQPSATPAAADGGSADGVSTGHSGL